MDESVGIEMVPGDTRPRCKAGTVIAGLYHRCDYVAEHDGWAHATRSGEAIWTF